MFWNWYYTCYYFIGDVTYALIQFISDQCYCVVPVSYIKTQDGQDVAVGVSGSVKWKSSSYEAVVKVIGMYMCL